MLRPITVVLAALTFASAACDRGSPASSGGVTDVVQGTVEFQVEGMRRLGGGAL